MRAWLTKEWRRLCDDLRENNGAPALDARTTAVFCISTVLLTIFYYYGKANYFRGSDIEAWVLGLGVPWVTRNATMLPYVYWGLSSLVIRVLIPLAVIVWAFRESPADYGLTWKGQAKHVPTYAGLYLFMLPFLIWMAHVPSFQHAYPFWDDAPHSGTRFWVYEGFYALQFIGVEFFFRGFVLFALFRKFGYHALLIVAIPYVMIHFNKPIPETLGALVAGIVLGYLALRAKSCVLGIVLHTSIAVTMDVLAMAQHHDGVVGALRSVLP